MIAVYERDMSVIGIGFEAEVLSKHRFRACEESQGRKADSPRFKKAKNNFTSLAISVKPRQLEVHLVVHAIGTIAMLIATSLLGPLRHSQAFSSGL
jgi:hypothetical protein